MSQIQAIKPFAEKYYSEEVLFEDYRYRVRRKFNQHFDTTATEYALQMCKQEIFDVKYKNNPPKLTDDEEENAKRLAIWNWTLVTSDEVADYFGLLWMQKQEMAKIILACEPLDGAPPIEEVLPYMDDEKIDLVKSFFTKMKSGGGLQSNGRPQSTKSLKKHGRARKRS